MEEYMCFSACASRWHAFLPRAFWLFTFVVQVLNLWAYLLTLLTDFLLIALLQYRGQKESFRTRISLCWAAGSLDGSLDGFGDYGPIQPKTKSWFLLRDGLESVGGDKAGDLTRFRVNSVRIGNRTAQMCPALLVFYLEITIAGVTVPTLGLVNVSALDDINFMQFFEKWPLAETPLIYISIFLVSTLILRCIYHTLSAVATDNKRWEVGGGGKTNPTKIQYQEIESRHWKRFCEKTGNFISRNTEPTAEKWCL